MPGYHLVDALLALVFVIHHQCSARFVHIDAVDPAGGVDSFHQFNLNAAFELGENRAGQVSGVDKHFEVAKQFNPDRFGTVTRRDVQEPAGIFPLGLKSRGQRFGVL